MLSLNYSCGHQTLKQSLLIINQRFALQSVPTARREKTLLLADQDHGSIHPELPSTDLWIGGGGRWLYFWAGPTSTDGWGGRVDGWMLYPFLLPPPPFSLVRPGCDGSRLLTAAACSFHAQASKQGDRRTPLQTKRTSSFATMARSAAVFIAAVALAALCPGAQADSVQLEVRRRAEIAGFSGRASG